MEITPKRVTGALVAAGALLLIGGALGRGCAPDVSEREQNRILTEQLEKLREEHKGVVVARNKQVSSLHDLINSKTLRSEYRLTSSSSSRISPPR